MRTITAPDVDAYLAAARDGDHRSAIGLALGFVDEGVSLDRVIEDLLIVAQRETGSRWLRAEWTVADEHAVSSTTTAVVEALATTAAHDTDLGSVVVVCAEGDWHSLPSRLCTEQLRGRGWTVRFLGASTPADHVAEYLTRMPQDGLVISCALPLYFAGAARLVDVAHQHGIPALIGGAAIAGGALRAVSLGADAAVSTLAEADLALRELGGTAVPGEPVRLSEDALLLDAEADDYASGAMAELSRRFPQMKGYDSRQLSRTREDLAYIVRFTAAALLVQDATVWTDFATWQRLLLDVRGVPERAFTAGAEVISGLVAAEYPHAAQLLLASVS